MHFHLWPFLCMLWFVALPWALAWSGVPHNKWTSSVFTLAAVVCGVCAWFP